MGIMEHDITYSPVCPGSLIKKELKDRGVSQKVFAEAIGMRPSHISEVINGNRRVTIQFADKVESWLGISAKLLLNLQLTYDLACKSNDADEYAADSFLTELDRIINVKALLKGSGKMTSVEKQRYMAAHYGITSVNALTDCFDSLASQCFRRSAKTGLDERMIATWVVKARSEAVREKPVAKFSSGACGDLCQRIVSILHSNNDTIARVKQRLSEYGIGFMVIEKLDHASIDGYSFYNGDTPYIVLTMRYKRIDNLAFTLMHELGHILLGHTTSKSQRISVDTRSFNDEDENTIEQEADRFASEWLIPDKLWKLAPMVPMNPFLIQRRYFEWAEKRGLNKWIVLGRLSHETGIYKFKSDDSRTIN